MGKCRWLKPRVVATIDYLNGPLRITCDTRCFQIYPLPRIQPDPAYLIRCSTVCPEKVRVASNNSERGDRKSVSYTEEIKKVNHPAPDAGAESQSRED